MNGNEGFSFIIPVFNSKANIANTLAKLYSAILKANLSNYEIIVVDDGSIDGTSDFIESLNQPNLEVLKQKNSGRLLARYSGIQASNNENIFFLDSRVELEEFALVNLLNSRATHNEEYGMIIPKIIFAKTKLIGIFWDSIARIVWFKYYKNDNEIILTDANFDHFPKGTTFLYTKKSLILEAYSTLTPTQMHSKDTNDDTLIIRFLVKKTLVLLCKSSQAVYFPRIQFIEFIRHAYHRGKVAGEGFFAHGSRGRKLFYLLTLFFSLVLGISIVIPMASLLFPLLLIFFEMIVLSRVSFRHFLSLNIYALPFLLVYLSGMLSRSYRKE